MHMPTKWLRSHLVALAAVLPMLLAWFPAPALAADPVVTASVSPSYAIPADGKSLARVVVTVTQPDGKTPAAGTLVTLAPGQDSHAIVTPLNPVATDQNGVAAFYVTDTTAEAVTLMPQVVANNLVTSFYNSSVQVIFAPYVPSDPAKSTITASPLAVVPDGKTSSTVTVTLLQADGSTPVAGHQVTVAQGAGTHASIGGGSAAFSTGDLSGISDGNGVVTFPITDSTAEAVTLTATDTTAGVTPARPSRSTSPPTSRTPKPPPSPPSPPGSPTARPWPTWEST